MIRICGLFLVKNGLLLGLDVFSYEVVGIFKAFSKYIVRNDSVFDLGGDVSKLFHGNSLLILNAAAV